jgi:ribonuclease HI
MTETAYNVMHSAFAFGPSKRGLAHRDTCPCGAASETVAHTFQDCARSKRLWELVLRQWRDITGESKLKATDGRVVLLGDRTGHWLDETEEAEFAGLETPFAIMHKATLHIIKKERDKDAASRDPLRARRTAAQLYQAVASVCELIARDRWWSARAKRHGDGGQAMVNFRRQWEAPGLIHIPVNGEPPRLLLFLDDRARDRYKRKTDSLRSRHFRNQRYAPPKHLPPGTISIFTDGSAIPRKRRQLFPPAGWGAVAVTNGRGHEHREGTELVRMGGPVNSSTPHVTTGTNNSSELVAFTRALQWAYTDRAAQGRPICMRYDSCYAAMIASGSWKAKAHKALAAEARAAWDALREKTRNQLWLRHVRGHSKHQWNDIADALAARGQKGERIYAVLDGG